MLIAVATGIVVASAVGALLRGPDPFVRLHFSTPMTSLAGPLLAAGLCLQAGWGLTAASVLLPVGLLFVTGPVLTAAIGRVLAERGGQLEGKGPK